MSLFPSSPSSPSHAQPVPSAALRRPLVVGARSTVLDELVRLAAAAGVEVDVVPDLVAARRSWSAASLVVVDDAVTHELTSPLPRREDVVLLGDDPDDASVWRRGVAVGADHVAFLPDAQQWLLEQFADARDGGREPARVLAVVGGRGGAGASTLAAALAVTAMRRRAGALLVDLDPLGGGIDLALGVETVDGLRWPDLAAARGRINGATLRDALPRLDELPVLAWDRGSDVEVPFEAARAVLDASRRVTDVVVVDLPRAGGPAAVHAATCADELLVVVPAEVRAVAAADRLLRVYRPAARSVRVVVRGPASGGLTARAVGEALGVGVAGELAAEPRLALAAERGEPPAGRGRGPLAELAGAVLDGWGVAGPAGTRRRRAAGAARAGR